MPSEPLDVSAARLAAMRERVRPTGGDVLPTDPVERQLHMEALAAIIEADGERAEAEYAARLESGADVPDVDSPDAFDVWLAEHGDIDAGIDDAGGAH